MKNKEVLAGVLGTVIAIAGCGSAQTPAQSAEANTINTLKYEVTLMDDTVGGVNIVDCFTDNKPEITSSGNKVAVSLKDTTCIADDGHSSGSLNRKAVLGVPETNPIVEIEIFVDHASVFPNPNAR